MMAPAGHVTVVVVKADVAEPHTVEYSWPGEAVTDGLAGREAGTERLTVADTDAMALAPNVCEGEREGERVRDTAGLTDALTRVHCT